MTTNYLLFIVFVIFSITYKCDAQTTTTMSGTTMTGMTMTGSTMTGMTMTPTTVVSTTTRCPGGQVEQAMYPTTAMNCLSPTLCNSGYTCLYSTTANTYVCCSLTMVINSATPSTTFTNCPNGYVQQPMVTSCLSPIVCAKGYTCTYSSTVSNYLCCNKNAVITGSTGSGTTTNGCASGLTQATSPANCLAPNVCGTGFTCTYSATAANYICCSGTSSSSSGTGTLTTSKCTNGAAQAASPSSCLAPNVCSSGFTCSYSASAANYICCATSG